MNRRGFAKVAAAAFGGMAVGTTIGYGGGDDAPQNATTPPSTPPPAPTGGLDTKRGDGNKPMRISNYTLNYPRQFREGKMDIFDFLAVCRQLGCDGASIHIRSLASTKLDYLKKVRRAYLDNGLSISMFSVSTNFGQSEKNHAAELKKTREAIRVGMFLGAPLLRIFAGSPPKQTGREQAFARAAAGVRQACEIGADAGLPIGLQNHNHGSLCRTGAEVLRFFKQVNHPNFVFILDTGQFAGNRSHLAHLASRGISGDVPLDLREANYLDSIQQTASLARHVRTKFYGPQADGSEPFVDYDKVFDILRGVHYQGFVDIVYEAAAGGGESSETAIPRVVGFLRSQIARSRARSAEGVIK